MPTVIIICAILNILFTIVPLSRNKHWLVRSMDFPRLQLMFISLAILVAIFTFSETGASETWVLATATALSLIWQLWWILPYTPVWSKEVKSCKVADAGMKLTVITSNVYTPNRNTGALIALVKKHQPDILVTLETDRWWEDQLKVIETHMPYCVKCPLDNFYGMHLYSKLRLHDEEISFLVEKDVPSIHVVIELESGVKVRAHFLHPAPPSPTENAESTERDAELIAVARSIAKSDEPIIVAGDLNDVAWSSTTRLFRKISGLLDPRIGRGMFSTFHVKFPLFRWPMDHLFHSDHFTLCSVQRLPSIGSDHFPLFASLSYAPAKAPLQNGLEADAEDHERARETVNEKGADNVPEPNAG